MKIQKPLPGMTPEETERQLHYMNAVIMFKVMHSRGIINEKELNLCKEEMLKKYKPPLDPYKDEVLKQLKKYVCTPSGQKQLFCTLEPQKSSKMHPLSIFVS